MYFANDTAPPGWSDPNVSRSFDDDDDGGDGGGGYDDDDGGGGGEDYDDVPAYNDDDGGATSSTSTDPAEAARQRLAARTANWERQCAAIDRANAANEQKYNKAVQEYDRKLAQWEKSTTEKCFSCSAKGGRNCESCKGAGSKAGKKCSGCDGKGFFQCLRCRGHKGLQHGPKGAFTKPKPPTRAQARGKPQRPT